MSALTKIAWCDATLSPWEGCSKVSPGCEHCYAEARDRRHLIEPVDHWGKGAPRRKVKGFELAARALDKKAIRDGKRHKVFPSLCDWLDPEVSAVWLADLLRVIYETPNLDWLLLTKRPEEMRRVWSVYAWANQTNDLPPWMASFLVQWKIGCYPPNVWIGVSVEDQQRADERLPILAKIPAVKRFVSIEPMLGPVNISHDAVFLPPRTLIHCPADWVIVGGETGPQARPCNVDWIRYVVSQCAGFRVPCFVKQLGAKPYFDAKTAPCAGPMDFELSDRSGADPAGWPEDLRVREFPNV